MRGLVQPRSLRAARMPLEFIDESELGVELDESVPLLDVPLLVLGDVPVPVLGEVLMPGDVLVLGELLVLGDVLLVLGAVDVEGLVELELGGLVVSLVFGVVVDDGVCVVVVDDVELELSVVDCA